MIWYATFAMAYAATYIYVILLANDGTYQYIPKRYRLKYRLRSYLAYLKAWRKHTWAKTKEMFRQWKRQIKLFWTNVRLLWRQTRKNVPDHQWPEGDSWWIFAKTAVMAKASPTGASQQHIQDPEMRRLGIDNRASAFISGDIEDFEGPLSNTNVTIKAFGGSRVKGVKQGTAVVRMADDEGRIHTFTLPNSYYVPGSKDRLLSPQHLAQAMRQWHKVEVTSTTNADKVVIQWGQYKRTIPLDEQTNVATVNTAPDCSKFDTYCMEAGFSEPNYELDPIVLESIMISDDEGDDEVDLPARGRQRPLTQSTHHDAREEWTEKQLPNTTTQIGSPNIIEEEEFKEKDVRKVEAEMLEYHYKYNHAPFAKLQEMARHGTIPRRLATCRIPACAACMYSKATKRPWRNKKTKNSKGQNKASYPGEVVSVDQLTSPTPGLVAQLTGKLTNRRYNYATVFVDNYSGQGYIYLQSSSGAEETMAAKLAYERECQKSGVRVKAYRADNGVFRSKKWMDHCRENRQHIDFTGVDAHHQNGRAEARIRRLQELSRTMLLHAAHRWPQEISASLWPYAMRMANDSINATPNMSDKQRRSPDQMFTNSSVTANPKHWKHFGCPVYTLNRELRSGTGIYHKWKARSQVGIYLGRSPQHSRSVALVLNPTTGLVSPQFHLKFDSAFDTVPQMYRNRSRHQSLWQIKSGIVVGKTSQRTTEQDTSREPTKQDTRRDAKEKTTANKRTATSQEPDGTREPTTPSEQPRVIEDDQVQNPTDSGDNVTAETPATAGPEQGTRRSTRPRKAVQRLIEAMSAEIDRDTHSTNEIFSYQALFPTENNEDTPDILAHKAKADPDTLYLHEARRQPDWEYFKRAMEQEIELQLSEGVYSVEHKSTVPEGAKVLNTVWQLRRKRDVRTNNIKKYKARCNIDGSQMIQGEHYEETYAPVAGWTAIRLVLAMVLNYNWHTIQMDYVLAYPQAPAQRELFMQIPKGFALDGVESPEDYVLKVHKNIYGGKDAGRTWYKYLRNKLENELGFTCSQYDECVFYKGTMIYVLYTDDSILVGPNRKELENAVRDIQKILNITVEGDLTDFLGVNIDRREDGTIKLSQPRLIDQIIVDLGLNDERTKTVPTPALSSKILTRSCDSRPFDGHFNYRSVIGKLHYLVAGSRSEIAYAVHQCARFSQKPMMEHAKAVKRIGRYLKGTRNEGTILTPDATKSLEVFVDADFAGNWDPKQAGIDRSTARSRHGYYITYGGIPIAWKSTLQQEIALSSTESEVTGLSYALRDTIPIINLLDEMGKRGYQVSHQTTKVHCNVFEDNSGAVEIATKHKFRPRTKHLNVRLFHFRDYVNNGRITIHPIKTEDQPADILTKPLAEGDFQRHRQTINGW